MYLQVRHLLMQIVVTVVVARTIRCDHWASPLLLCVCSGSRCRRLVRELLLRGVRRLHTTAIVRIHVGADRTVRWRRHVPVHHGRGIIRIQPIDRTTR
uniref:Putative secreted peptide n=1 Tax=Anopheles braziliensis TaxID=58242 RepID=A0A2M3ZQI4_9DIPT